jgi:hypothetical protein
MKYKRGLKYMQMGEGKIGALEVNIGVSAVEEWK